MVDRPSRKIPMQKRVGAIKYNTKEINLQTTYNATSVYYCILPYNIEHVHRQNGQTCVHWRALSTTRPLP